MSKLARLYAMLAAAVLVGVLLASGCAHTDGVELGAACRGGWFPGCEVSTRTVIRFPQGEPRQQPNPSPIPQDQSRPDFSIDPNVVWGHHQNDWAKTILQPAYDLLVSAFGTKPDHPVEVYHSYGGGPRLSSSGNLYRIQLSIIPENNSYQRWTYQFAHEFAHALIGPQHNSRFDWWEETQAELASLWVIQSYAHDPDLFVDTMYPAESWQSYLDMPSHREDRWQVYRIAESDQVHDWFPRLESRLSDECCLRALNHGVAQELLPHFISNPSLWRSLRYVNAWDSSQDASFADYLDSWERTLIARGLGSDVIRVVKKVIYGNEY